ncbi:MAG: divergent polysaccharide deacetylase family protein [Proteobacteria bacterium]|nr:divergent polysaccharide deacetylase family protein [Pseudomonadota bacterium]
MERSLRQGKPEASKDTFGVNPLFVALALLVAVAAGIVIWLSLAGAPEVSTNDAPLVIAVPPEFALEDEGVPTPEDAHREPVSEPAGDVAPEISTFLETDAVPESPPGALEAVPPARSPATETPIADRADAGAADAGAADTGAADTGAADTEGDALDIFPEDDIVLLPAPDRDLIEESEEGALPMVGPDGRAPWQVYARPFEDDDARPRIAIVLMDLGLSEVATNAAIRMPGTVTLSFAPYARDLEAWSILARAAGHEIMLDIPMEPVGYPTDDPGPHTLLTSLSADDNIARLEWLLSRFTGYVGIVDQMGSKFTASRDAVQPVLAALERRGLMVLDSRATSGSVLFDLAQGMGLPSAANDGFLDDVASRAAIDDQLAALERRAREKGYAVGIGRPYPVTIDRIAAWLPAARTHGFAIAPVSALATQ